MNTKLLALTFSLGAMLLATHHTFAQGRRNCADREVVIARLADRYGEARQAIGLGANNAVVEVFASRETGTWTITVTLPGGLTCLVASGQAYEALSEELTDAAGSDT